MSSASPRARASQLSVATYNVHRCVGIDRREAPARIASVLAELEADVIALQEVQGSTEDAESQLATLARTAGYDAHPGPTLRDHRGDYGNALLTRLALADLRRVDLSMPGREPRGALVARVRTREGALVRVVATHLGLGRAERHAQATRLGEELARESVVATVLMGDLNEWLPLGTTLAPVLGALAASPRRATFPTRRPVLSLDRILTGHGCALHEARVHRSALARVASDHLPLRGELGIAQSEAEA